MDIRAIVAFDPYSVPARIYLDWLGYALCALGAAAMVNGERFGRK